MRYFNNLQDFYNSKEWQQCKEHIKNKRLTDDGFILDEVTGKPLLRQYDMVFHHKIELTLANVNDPTISLNPENIMIVSHKTHNELHQRFGFYERKVYLVHGNICSGKSSFVKNIASKDDIILDMDNIWQMVSVNERYQKPKRLNSVVFAIRDCIKEQIRIRNGMWFCAYVITTSPSVLERKRMIERLGVSEVIHIDTDKETCLKRLYDNPNGRNIEEYEQYIIDYDNRFQPDEQALQS